MRLKFWPVLLAGILSGLVCMGAATADAGPVSSQGLELMEFTIEAPDRPKAGDMAVIEFTLRNTNKTPVRFDSNTGVIVGSRWISDSGKKRLNRDFGYSHQGWKLEPGQSLKIRVSRMLDIKGRWLFFPAYKLNGKWGDLDSEQKSIMVGSGTAPLANGTRITPGGGSSVVIYKGQTLPMQVFPPDNPWNQDISKLPVHPQSAELIASVGANTSIRCDFGSGNRFVVLGQALKKGREFGIPFSVARKGTKPSRVLITNYKAESDPGPYYFGPDATLEGQGKGDAHLISVHYDQKRLYELYNAKRTPDGGWQAMQGTVWDLTSNKLRPWGWTSADAAGLPIWPGLVRYEEVHLLKEIRHALRFTVKKTRRAFILPATHWASRSKDPKRPPMGMRVRLNADFDIEPFPEPVQVILRCLKKYGMILADNGGNWFISGAPHPKWNDDSMNLLKKVKGKDLEVVYTGETITKIPR